MNRQNIESRIRMLMKNYAMLGGDRELSFSQPIGEQGLGFDSLAVVEFAVAFEQAFQVELPDEFWSERPQLTLGHFADFIEQSKTRKLQTKADAAATLDAVEPSPLRKLCSRVVRRIYEKHEYHILKYDLLKHEGPFYNASLDLTFGELSTSDQRDFGKLYGNKERDRKLVSFKQRLNSGYIGFGAWDNKRLVGVDWITPTGDHEPWLGLEIRMVSGGCYGVDLQEHPEYGHKGVGMAILAYSLMESRNRGFKSQFTVVSPENTRMLSAAIQLFGFERVAGLQTTLFLRKARSTLELDGVSREIKTLEL